MAFEEGIEELTCQACGAKHHARWSRMPVREKAVLKCRACREILFEGKTVRDYYELHSL